MSSFLLISDSYPPEICAASVLMRELSENLTQSGHQVDVLTVQPVYRVIEQRKIPELIEEESLRIIRVKGSNFSAAINLGASVVPRWKAACASENANGSPKAYQR